MQARLDGKTALITGSSLGLGKAMALRFAEAGASVAIVARRAGVLEQARTEVRAVAKGGKVEAFSCDVSNAADCATLYDDVSKALGPVDILVNNAGTSQRGPFLDISDELWASGLELKLFAAIRLSRLSIPHMQKQRWGRIINVLNIGAKAPPAEGAPTAVSRAAGLALTKAMSKEFAKDNVLINSLHVGIIESDQWVRRHAGQNTEGSYEEFLARMGKPIPLGRVGKAEEFANIACFLASDLASYITGTSINVDGGSSPVV